jgi:hypothetical protein
MLLPMAAVGLAEVSARAELRIRTWKAVRTERKISP